MLIVDILFVLFGFGLPVTILTWYLFLRLYDSGELDRSLTRKELGPHMKDLRKKHRKEETRSTHLVHNRWMRFGGGFYGLAALWTFVVIEVVDIASFLWNFPGFAALFDQGFISFLVDALINQFQNFVGAIVWFVFWGNDGTELFLAPIVGYLGYLLGMRLARENIPLEKEGLRTFLKRLMTPEAE